jgi:hypothetical protein
MSIVMPRLLVPVPEEEAALGMGQVIDERPNSLGLQPGGST